MKNIALVMIAVLAICSTALAHGGHNHVMGTVTKVTADSIQVKTANGETKDVMIDSTTTYTKAGKKASVTDVTEGARVVIDAHPMKDMHNMLQAESVKIGTGSTDAAGTSHKKQAEKK